MRSRRGMSMLEVLMALALLAVAVLAILGMFPALAQSNKNAMETSKHLYSAQEKLDALLLANSTISTTYSVDYPFGTGLSAGYRRWRGIADTYGAIGGKTMQTIEVEVTWVQEGRTRSTFLYGMVNP